jgi:hypothetical protein
MNYGWAWKTPLQHRFGCGYVYDSSYITKEQAIEEVKNKFGNDIEIVNNFSYNSGYYKDTLIKNCLSIGLSTSFFEPMEATAIFTSIMMCRRFINLYADEYFIDNNEQIARKYNLEVTNFHEDMLAFLYFHYITNKQDTDFWKNFTKNNIIPKRTSMYIEKLNNIFSNKILNEKNDRCIFPFKSWIVVYFGNEIYNKDNLEYLVNDVSKTEYEIITEEIKNNKNGMTMDEYLKHISIYNT